MRRIDNDSSSRRTIEHQPPLSASTSLRRLFAQPALSPNTPGLSVEFLAQKIGPKLDEQSNKGEGISVHIKSFFKNLSKQWHLQEEIDKTNQNPAAAINERECRSEIEFSAYWYGEFAEELKDHSQCTTKREQDNVYDSTSKESHPFFDGRFVKVDGLIQYDPEWEERQLAKQKRRRRRLAGTWFQNGQNTVVTKAA